MIRVHPSRDCPRIDNPCPASQALRFVSSLRVVVRRVGRAGTGPIRRGTGLDWNEEDESIIGQRDPTKTGSTVPRGPGVFVFAPKPNPTFLAFERHTIDDGGMAREDALAADRDGDGRSDLIAGGRATHNVKIYSNRQQ